VGTFISELIITDLLLVEKRIENIAKEMKKKATDAHDKEMRLMEACKAHLEKEQPLASFPFTEEQDKDIRAYQFVTRTPLVIVLNIDDKLLADETPAARVREQFKLPCVQICVGLEEEIMRLEESERASFMQALGISEAAIDRMTRLVFESLNLISFFTVGKDEVRAWPLKRGSAALDAAGSIHSDLARGFIRAEMMKCADLMAAGSEGALKDEGKKYLKGKEYVVEDGDILSINFNV
jgi:ribosome-binding ATPase YchF (GTP1/OBG family)